MTASTPFLANTILSFNRIDPKNAEHTALLLPMFPEYISAQYPTGCLNHFDLPQGRTSFIVHRKQGEGDGYLYRPTVKLALEEMVVKVAMNGHVVLTINDSMSPQEKLAKLHEILQCYSMALDLARIAARSHKSEGFFELGDGYMMRPDVCNSQYFQVVRKTEFEPWGAFCIDRSLVPAFTDVHFDRLRHRLQLFQHLLNDTRFQHDGTSGLTTRIAKQA